MNEVYVNLQKLGLNQNEITIYLELLRRKSATIVDLTVYTNIPRTTIVENVGRLEEKGLVFIINEHNAKYIFPEHPKKLKLLLDAKISESKELVNHLMDLSSGISETISRITDETRSGISQVKVEVHENMYDIDTMYDEILCAEEILAYYNEPLVQKFFTHNINKFISAIEKRNFEVFDFDTGYQVGPTNFLSQNSHLKTYQEKKIVNHINLSSIDYLIFDSSIAMVEVSKGRPIGIVIRSELVHNNARNMHAALWELV